MATLWEWRSCLENGMTAGSLAEFFATLPEDMPVVLEAAGEELPTKLWLHSIVKDGGKLCIRVVHGDMTPQQVMEWAPQEWIDQAIKEGLLPPGFKKPRKH
jgi:hypothetical protein